MATQKIETGLIADSAVTTAKIADNSVTGAKIAAASLDDQVKGISSSADAVAITIDSSENVGIGTSSPDEPLHIFSSTDADLLLEGTETGSSTRFAKVAFANNISGTTTDLGAITANTDGATNSSAFKFYTANAGSVSEKMIINSSGNVGIGISTPTLVTGKIAHIHGTAAGVHLTDTASGTTSGDGAYFVFDNPNLYIQQKEAGPMIFETSGTERMRIDSSGKVGIGTDNPSYPFHVTGSGDTVAAVTAGASSIAALNLGNSTNLADGGIRYDNSADVLIFRAANAEKMRIDSGGRVMIAESSNSGYSANADDLIVGDNGSATERGISIGATSGGSIRWNDGADTGIIEYAHSSDSMRLYTAGSERMRINSSGRVGIGTDSPDGLLHLSSGTSGDAILILESDTDNNDEADNPQIWLKGDGDITKGAIRVADNQLQIISNVSAESGIKFYVGSTDNTGTTDPGTSATEKMQITSGGSLQVGTTSTTNQAYRIESYAGDYYQMMLRAPTYPTLKFKADNQNSGNNASISVGAGNSFVIQPNSTTNGIIVSNSGHVTMPNQPAFHVYGPSAAVSDGSVVVYTYTYVNTGSHYSTSNGRFTAPVAGVYLFFWGAIGNNTNDVYRWFLHKNGSATGIGGNDVHLRQDTSATGSEYATNGSRVQMVSLSANDYVHIYYDSDGGTSGYYQSDYVNFGGYLIG